MGRFSKLETGGLGDEKTASESQSAFKVRRPKEPVDESAPTYDANYYLSEADRYLYSGQFDKALRLYSRSSQQRGALADAWVGQVLCLCLQRQTVEAQNWSRRALEIFPEDARLISLQGLAYAMAGTVQRGLACSDFALSRQGNDPLTWMVRGLILELAENPNSAPCLHKALEVRSPHDWRIALLIGMILMNLNRQGKALEYLEIATKEAPGNDLCWERLGEACGRLGLGSRAAEAYRTALQINPSNQKASQGLASVTNSSVIVRLMRRLFRR